LVDLSASDVEILEEGGSLGGENIVIEEGYKDKQARRKKGRLFGKKSLGNENDGIKLSLRSGAKEWDVDDGVWGRRRDGAHIDPEKMFKSRRKTRSESNELTCGVDKCPVEKKWIPPDTRRRGRGESSLCASRKRRRNAEDSGYTSKLEGNEEEKSGDKAHQEDVAVVDLCFTSNSSYEASADSKQGSSSVEMVGEVHVALETSISDNQDISWCDEGSLKQPDSKRPRLELFLNKMEWYLATLAEPECSEVDLDLSHDAEDRETFISED